MSLMEIILGIVIAVFSVALVILVLMQSGKDKRLSGTIAGGAETFFGKSKAQKHDKLLGRVTTLVSFLFVALMIVMYILVANKY